VADVSARPATLYLGLETLHQDGHQQVEEDVVAEGHERDEVQGGHGSGGGHAVVEHLVPVLLGQDLERRKKDYWRKSTAIVLVV